MPLQKDFITTIFITKLGLPTDQQSFDQYIDHLQSSMVQDTKDQSEYTELHHVFPQAVFPEHKSSEEYLIRLLYEDHIHAHELLFKAYPIREFLNPLNFMKSGTTNKLKSGIKSVGWKLFRETPQYESWLQKRIEHAKKIQPKDHMTRMTEIRYMDPESRTILSKHAKKMWEDPIKRETIIQNMITAFNEPAIKQVRSDYAKRRWEDTDFRKEMTEKMMQVNKSETKRKDASEKLKTRWSDPSFREKMATRKKRGPGKPGMKWWNNGADQKLSSECPGDDYHLGRLKRAKKTGEPS